MRSVRIAAAKDKAKRVKTLATGKRSKSLITRASLQAGALYACELDPLTLHEIAVLRVATATALNCHFGPNNRIAAMHFDSRGIFEPKAL